MALKGKKSKVFAVLAGVLGVAAALPAGFTWQGLKVSGPIILLSIAAWLNRSATSEAKATADAAASAAGVTGVHGVSGD